MAKDKAEIRYIPVVEVAKLVRRALKAAYPDTRFSVRSNKYAGGASIHVSWIEGPSQEEVAALVKCYEGGRFDGTIDMMYYADHWLRPDGSVLVRHDRGSAGSGGEAPEVDNRVLEHLLPEDAEPVHFGADFIFVWRESDDTPLEPPLAPPATDDGVPF